MLALGSVTRHSDIRANKLGLSAYYDKRYVLADSIHTTPLDF